MQALIDYIIYDIKQKHINDPAIGHLDNILEIVLLSNRYETGKYINSIIDKETYWIVSNHFGYISGQWQDIEFIKLIERKTEEFKGIVEESYYKRFIDNIKESIDALDEDVKKDLI
ncbi:hypothetical protein INQ45_00775 [Flavobacterium columnare]|uniref:hypothetical protein n=1 Tax=Flavobacterium columnare TaxID=996 RepID=UPI002D2107AF|nr:hypothetical protein [Flavobacterium columnare]MEB3799670.1 hypothetical protein [Flavobacterium columnare]